MPTLKNFLLKFLIACARLFRLKQNPLSKNPRILVISTTGLGDTLWATPALKALKKKYPHSLICVLTSPIGEKLLKHCPYVDKIFIAKDPLMPKFFKLLRELRREKFEWGIIFHISQRPLIPLCILAGVSKLTGTQGQCKGLDEFLTDPFPQKYQHEITRRLTLIDASSEDKSLELYIQDDDPIIAKNYLKNQGIDLSKPLIGIHPGSKDIFKQWNPAHFIEVGNFFRQEKNAQVIITGNEREAHLTTSIAQNIPSAISLAGKLSIALLGAIMKHYQLFFTNDTGPMHMAFALKIPTIALFCATDPKICGPLELDKAWVIQKEKTCYPCIKKQCRRAFCMEQISPREVIDFLKKGVYV